MTISPHQPMIRGVRLLNAFQQGLTLTEFGAALENPTLAGVVDTLLRRRGASWARSPIVAAAGSLSAAQAAAYLTSGHILSPYVAASGVAMSAVAASAPAMVEVLESAAAFAAISAVPTAKSAIMASTALAVANVPTMTSNTTPAGIASASTFNPAGFDAWKAFDRNTSTWWSPTAFTNQWIQYEFTQPVFIHTASAHPYATPYSPNNCRIECSSNGVDFVTAAAAVLTPGAANTVAVSRAGFYKFWRLFAEDSTGSAPSLYELNFTGFVKP